jgi:DNA-binding response OmpR family regulator
MRHLDLLIENAHPTINLTNKEHKVLAALIEGVYSRNDLLHQCFGWSVESANKATYNNTRSVDMTVSRLNNKISDCGMIIKSIRGKGYRIILAQP